MRNLGKFCRQIVFMSVLLLAFAGSTFAGEIQYPGETAAPPAITNGDVQCLGATIDPLTEIVLSLLQSAMSLL
jgi:hypothetical protein